MYKKIMEQMCVYLGEEGCVCIKQTIPFMNDAIVYVDSEQIDLLVKWLNEAKLAVLDQKENDQPP